MNLLEERQLQAYRQREELRRGDWRMRPERVTPSHHPYPDGCPHCGDSQFSPVDELFSTFLCRVCNTWWGGAVPEWVPASKRRHK